MSRFCRVQSCIGWVWNMWGTPGQTLFDEIGNPSRQTLSPISEQLFSPIYQHPFAPISEQNTFRWYNYKNRSILLFFCYNIRIRLNQKTKGDQKYARNCPNQNNLVVKLYQLRGGTDYTNSRDISTFFLLNRYLSVFTLDFIFFFTFIVSDHSWEVGCFEFE